jgi:AcrR family transcriptional regulator
MKQRLATVRENSEDGTKSRILRVALELFAEFSFGGVSTRKIAEVAQCNIASVCYYFGGKKKLYLECLQHLTLEGNTEIKEILKKPESKQDFEQKLLRFCEVFAKYTSDNGAPIKLHINEISAKKKLPIECNLLQNIDGMLEVFLFESRTQGIISKNIDTALFSKMVLSTILGQKLFKVFRPYDEVSDREFARNLVRSSTSGFYCQ